MQLSDFDFDLPEDRIATEPVEPRDASRLLQVSKFFFDFTFNQLPDLLNPGDVLVFNDSKVIPARLYGIKQGIRSEASRPSPLVAEGVRPIARSSSAAQGPENQKPIELLLHKPCGDHWLAFAKPGKKLKVGDVVHIAEGFDAEVLEKRESGEVLLDFHVNGDAVVREAQQRPPAVPLEESSAKSQRKLPAQLTDSEAKQASGDLSEKKAFFQALEAHGHVPLPPYIKRADTPEDRERYQNVYARDEAKGSVAAPTAGLHFTPELLARLDEKGIQRAHLTLHVGAGTFQPVKVEDISQHVMHAEWAQITEETAEQINRARANGGKVIAVGTTALRTLESAARADGTLAAFCAETDIFITPGYEFKIVDRLITNFHLPKSTLMMLICAFSGFDRMHAAYAHAIRSGYRFYSYGDACLLDRMT